MRRTAKSVGTSPSPRTLRGYPALSREALGWLRYMHRKVRIPDDWAKEGRPSDAWDAKTSPPTLNWHRFDLTFASMAIAMMAEITPAWREAYEEILGSLAERMTTYWAWHDWIEQRGEDPARDSYPPVYYQLLIPPGLAGKYNIPGYAGNGLPPHPFEPDPIATSGNLYYKGFFNFVLGLYEYVSGSRRFDREFALVYDDDTRFVYDHGRIAETLARQWVRNADGIHCEVCKIWPMCTFLAGLGLRMYDAVHRTARYPVWKTWYAHAKRHYISRVDNHPPEWLTLYYDPDIPVNFKTLDARAWLLAAWFLLPHDGRMARLLYQGAKRRFLVAQPGDRAYLTSVSGCIGDDAFSTALGLSLATELGDRAVAIRLGRWVRDHYQATVDAERGEFYYRFRLKDPFPRGQYNALIMPSVVGGPKTWARIFSRPNLAKFRQPTVRGIEMSRLAVSQAFYDERRRRLVVSIHPIGPRGDTTTFRVTNLGRARRYSVHDNGRLHREWTLRDEEMVVSTTVGDHAFVIQRK